MNRPSEGVVKREARDVGAGCRDVEEMREMSRTTSLVRRIKDKRPRQAGVFPTSTIFGIAGQRLAANELPLPHLVNRFPIPDRPSSWALARYTYTLAVRGSGEIG